MIRVNPIASVTGKGIDLQIPKKVFDWETRVVEEFHRYVDPNRELILRDYERFYIAQKCGVYMPLEAMYAGIGPYGFAGQCFRGETGYLTYQCYIERCGTDSPEVYMIYHYFRNRIVYYPGAIAAYLVYNRRISNSKRKKLLRRMVLQTIAHERRHAVQPGSLFVNTINWEQAECYDNAPHEIDAEQYAIRVSDGLVSLDEVANY